MQQARVTSFDGSPEYRQQMDRQNERALVAWFAIPLAGVDKALHKEIFVKKIKKLEKINFITNKNK
jgi:predicted GIY-YIG superfamily endonuclease